MSWDQRLKEAAYTAPDGTRLEFQYEDVSRSVEKKTSGYEFPDANGTYVQDLGNTGRRYPLRMFFWGRDYDLEVQAFEEALLQRGRGVLEHPMYGQIKVVPFGEITRRDDLKTAGNQAVLEVTFWETIDIVYPRAEGDLFTEVQNSINNYNGAFAKQFSKLDSLGEPFKVRYQSVLSTAKNALKTISETRKEVEKRFNTIDASINNAIDVLIGDPLTLAFQTSILIQEPARAYAAIRARLDAYRNLAEQIITGDNAVATAGLTADNSNNFHMDDLFVSGYVSGQVVSGLNGAFKTRPQAISAAEEILDLSADVFTWRDDNYTSLEEIDTGEGYQALQDAVALGAAYLVELSFSLQQERHIVLGSARTPIDLCAELYGSVDTNLDFLISSNNLTGSEILELPAGKDIVYYI